MRRVEVWRSLDGQLHEDFVRAAAADLHHVLPQHSADPNRKVLSLSDCLAILRYREKVEAAFAGLDAAMAPRVARPEDQLGE